MDQLPRLVAIIGGLFFLGGGLYALTMPQEFFDAFATFDPYNEHFIHDIGAFQIGIGAMLVLVATMKDGLYAALAGATIGQGAHLAAHIIDRDLGANQSTTIPLLSLVAGAFLVATLIRARAAR